MERALALGPFLLAACAAAARAQASDELETWLRELSEAPGPSGFEEPVAQVFAKFLRDNAFYVAWDAISCDRASFERWLDEWVRGVPDRRAYVEKLGRERVASLRADTRLAAPVNYGY